MRANLLFKPSRKNSKEVVKLVMFLIGSMLEFHKLDMAKKTLAVGIGKKKSSGYGLVTIQFD